MFEIENLKNEITEEELLPSKNETAKLAWEMANNSWLKGGERVNALRLFAEIAGHMPEKNVNKNIKIEGKGIPGGVMVVKDYGTDEEWEESVLAQQTRLTSE